MGKKRVLSDLGLAVKSFLWQDLLNPAHICATATLDHVIDDDLIKVAWEKTKRVYPVIDAVLWCKGCDVHELMSAEAFQAHAQEHLYLVEAEDGANEVQKSKVRVAPGTEAVGGRTICVSYYGHDIHLSCYHTVVDGGGMIQIMRTLLYFYLALYTGHEDEHPVVEVTEGREFDDCYRPLTEVMEHSDDFTPKPLFLLPQNCTGFIDADMTYEGDLANYFIDPSKLDAYTGTVDVSAADFMRLCKETGANPSAMFCVLLARAAYELNPEESREVVFEVTISEKASFGLESSVANAVGMAIAYATRQECEGKDLSKVAQRIRADIGSQRGRDYAITASRLFDMYARQKQFVDRVVTYLGIFDIGSNTSHIVDFSVGAFSNTTFYALQLNDRFRFELQYGLATQKYVDKLANILADLGVDATVAGPAHRIVKESQTAIL